MVFLEVLCPLWLLQNRLKEQLKLCILKALLLKWGDRPLGNEQHSSALRKKESCAGPDSILEFP